MIAKPDSINPDESPESDSDACPTPEAIRSYLVGRVDSSAFNRITLHLNDCFDCQEALQQLPASDPWVDRFRGELDRRFMDEQELPAAMVTCVQSPSQSLQASSVLPPTESIGAYELIRPLGRGGMGTVYLARHQTLNRLCAIKLLPYRAGQERFDREVQSLAAIDHPGVVPATDAGTHDRWRYLVMQYVDGVDLADVLDSRGCLPLAVVCRIGADMASALSAIHHAGLIHRDIKPANVMLTRDGEIKVLDFGLAAASTVDTTQDRLTTVGDLVGTVAYAAPEQLAGHVPTVAVDWYAFGATLFRMFTGSITHPDAARHGLTALMMAKSNQDFEPNERLSDELPSEIVGLIQQLLSRDPEDRIADSGHIIETLRRHQESDTNVLVRFVGTAPTQSIEATAPHPVLPASASRQPPKNRLWIAVAAGFLGGALTLAATGWFIEFKSKNGTVQVETDQDDFAMKITERSDSPAASAEPSTQPSDQSPVDRALASTDPVKLDAVYQGKTVRQHLATLSSELDIPTLVASITAVSRVAEADDVDLVHATFVPARRYGGWVAGTNSPSGQFMEQTEVAYKNLPKAAVAKVAIKEFEFGNEQSIALIQWYYVMSGLLADDTITENDIEGLIQAVNRYQSAYPTMDTDHRNGVKTLNMNVNYARSSLLTWAAGNMIAWDEIEGIRTWLPSRWAPAETFDWMVDDELLRQVDPVLNPIESASKQDVNSTVKAVTALMRKPWPMMHDASVLTGADALGIETPIQVRLAAVLSFGNRVSSEQRAEIMRLDTLSETQQRAMANMIVLHAFATLHDKIGIEDQGGFGQNLDHRDLQRPYGTAFAGDSDYIVQKWFAVSDLWIDQLDELHEATDLPTLLDLSIDRLLTGHLDVKKNPNSNPITNIAYVEPSSTPQGDSANTFGGGGMGGFGASPKPSLEDKAKAREIFDKLRAYQDKRQAKNANDADLAD